MSHKRISEGIFISCGDFKAAPFVMRYLELKYGIRDMDIATSASGSRTLSFWGVENGEIKQFRIKQEALFLDIDKYAGHRATRGIIVDHILCAYWPEFENEQDDIEAHCASLPQARRKLRERYPQLKEILLICVILDRKTEKPTSLIEIDEFGQWRKIDPLDKPKLAISAV